MHEFPFTWGQESQLIIIIKKTIWLWVNTYRYILSGMNIHLPAILGFTRYQGFDPSPYFLMKETMAPRSPGEERFAVGLGGDAASMWIRPFPCHVTGPRGLTPGDQKMWGKIPQKNPWFIIFLMKIVNLEGIWQSFRLDNELR